MLRRASSDLLQARHRELLPPWRGLPSLLRVLLPSLCFTLMNTRFPPSLVPLTPYSRPPQRTISTYLNTFRASLLGARGSEVSEGQWGGCGGDREVRYLAVFSFLVRSLCGGGASGERPRAAVLGPHFPGASQHGIVPEEMMPGGARKRSAGVRSLCCSPRYSDGL
jgi:hypothetical protein